MNTEIQFDKLLQLAQHLEIGVLGHKVFDFSTYNTNVLDNIVSYPPNECGTNGCAAGECPIIWPDLWEFNYLSGPVLKNPTLDDYNPYMSLVEFFGLDPLMVDHLFFPRKQDTKLFGGNRLHENATKEQAAANIRAFVEKMKS